MKRIFLAALISIGPIQHACAQTAEETVSYMMVGIDKLPYSKTTNSEEAGKKVTIKETVTVRTKNQCEYDIVIIENITIGAEYLDRDTHMTVNFSRSTEVESTSSTKDGLVEYKGLSCKLLQTGTKIENGIKSDLPKIDKDCNKYIISDDIARTKKAYAYFKDTFCKARAF